MGRKGYIYVVRTHIQYVTECSIAMVPHEQVSEEEQETNHIKLTVKGVHLDVSHS